MKMPNAQHVGQGQKHRTARSTLRYRTPTINIVQIRSRLLEDCDDLENALEMLPANPISSVTDDLEMISATANRIVDALRLKPGALL